MIITFNIAIQPLQASRSITDKITNTGSDREAMLYIITEGEKLSLLPSTQTACGESMRKRKRGFKIRTPAVILESWRQSHLAYLSGQVTCSEWVGGPREVLIWVEWTEVTGLELRAHGTARHNPTPAPRGMLLQQQFLFYFLPSLFLFYTPSPPSSFHHRIPDPHGKSIKNLYDQCLGLHFTVRTYGSRPLLHQYWEERHIHVFLLATWLPWASVRYHKHAHIA